VISVEEARAILARLGPLGTESVPLAQAAGRVLAAEVRADRDWPPFATSAMDGYAVRLEDAAGPAAELAERPSAVMAGDAPGPALTAGLAVRVMTGAPLPEGTGAVVPIERVRRDGGHVRLEVTPAAGENVRRRGESVAAGDLLLSAGRRIGAGEVALLASAGVEPAPVYRRPRVALAATGNELVPAGSSPGPAQLRDSNGPMLVALCAARGWTASAAGRVPDEPNAVRRLFTDLEATDALLTTGGVSVGDLDLLPPAAREAGFELLFHGVAVRPGKPIAVARRGDVLWFGLPGNPVSASVGFHLFVREGLDHLEGVSNPGAPRVTALLDAALPATGPRETYRDGRITAAGGALRVAPLRSRGSHDIAAHARANGLIRTLAGAPALAAGERVECVLFGEWPHGRSAFEHA
jgi:molybdopterin molybdotransferase